MKPAEDLSTESVPAQSGPAERRPADGMDAASPSPPPFWLPVLAGVPIGICLIVMALPVLGHGHATAYRTLYLLAYLAWTLPLTALQRALWRRRTPLWAMAVLLLAVTYLMSLANNALGEALAWGAGWQRSTRFEWAELFRGLDTCWLALIAFCAVHAVVAYYAELKHEQGRRLRVTALVRDAELRALRYQLRPHFLFNTLNGISALVAENRNREARDMIARLSDFLRATLEGSHSHEVALADELALTETYLEIEKARLGERLRLKWQLGPDLLHARVPCLLLQPLVENAIHHGIARRAEAGAIEIRIAREGGRLHLRLSNDTAPAADAAPRPGAVGLRNIRERLQKLYPGEHAFRAGPGPDGGFEVQLSLPFRDAPSPRERAA